MALCGLAFQLVDDLLDFTAFRRTSRKPVLSDLKEGKVTLPLDLCHGKGHRDAAEIVRGCLRKGIDSVRPERL